MAFSKVTRYPSNFWTGAEAREDYAKQHGLSLGQVMWDYNLGWYQLWHEVKDGQNTNT